MQTELSPCGLFTCASNVVLIPKGLAKPTDQLDAVRRVVIKRHIVLYGEDGLPGLSKFRDKMVPGWYKDLNSNDPVLIPDLDKRLKLLFEYRLKRLCQIFSNPVTASDRARSSDQSIPDPNLHLYPQKLLGNLLENGPGDDPCR